MNQIVVDKIIKSKRKTISIIVNEDAQLIIRCPYNITQKSIDKIVIEKSKWIKEKKELQKNRIRRKKDFIEGESFLFLGKNYKLTITNCSSIKRTQNSILLPEKYESQAYLYMTQWYKKQASQIILDRVKNYAIMLDIKYKSAKISNAKTRWGSCSTKSTLNFTWRLVMAPLEVIDYVVVHELMHIKQHNHSKQFWVLVAEVIPDYKIYIDWLKKNQEIMKI